MNLLKRFFSFSREKETAHDLYRVVVEQARQPVFYRDFAVEDSIDGRFDMITLHMALVIRRLRRDADVSRKLSQALFDYMFDDMDLNLRELGVGDMGVLKRVKKMAKAFYGRLDAYDKGIDESGDSVLIGALKRNLYRDRDIPEEILVGMADYVRRQSAHLEALHIDSLMKGEVSFAAPPQAVSE